MDCKRDFYYFRMEKLDISKQRVPESKRGTSAASCRQPKSGRGVRQQPQENVQQPTLTTGEKIRQWLNTFFRCISACVNVVELVTEFC